MMPEGLCREMTISYHGNKNVDAIQILDAAGAAKLVTSIIPSGIQREIIVVACLDSRHRAHSWSIVSVGTLGASLVHPRDVFAPALLTMSSSILVGHNHPTGITEPSMEDIDVTKRLLNAADLLGIRLLDHVIVGPDGQWSSLKELGYLNRLD